MRKDKTVQTGGDDDDVQKGKGEGKSRGYSSTTDSCTEAERKRLKERQCKSQLFSADNAGNCNVVMVVVVVRAPSYTLGVGTSEERKRTLDTN